MKWLLRLFLITTFSLWLINRWFPEGLVMDAGWYNLAKVGAGLTIGNLLVRPLIGMLMLPINLITFGLFRWVTNVLILWLVAYFVGGITIHSFNFTGFTFNGLVIPPWSFNGWIAWIVIAFSLSLISEFLVWLTE